MLPSGNNISIVNRGLYLMYYCKKCQISNVLTVDVIQKIVKIVTLRRHVQTALGKNVVAGLSSHK
jgi:hypothetical protein